MLDKLLNSWMLENIPVENIKVLTTTTVPPIAARAPTPKLIVATRRSVSVL
ncbi:hypothetical protein I553_5114 [Mycobacterium xenopi 4042]|uniref:Uncharacterized protein n=1 Tax=Mycobacterium xenopi 4042 TaxID=1299334 RepID=X7ZXC5_MYCXE|nr:hypothetical protein I553_5114 [Mycobacterium xenopi 4042]